jgi:hypothetical protein
MLPVNVEAGDPPVWNWRGVLVVLAFVFDVRQFLGAAVLAPSLSEAGAAGIPVTIGDMVQITKFIER